jgi:L-asparaginase II
MEACFAAPDLVAGEGRFDTIVMRGLPGTAFAKGGAEGVHCAALPALGIGVAVKVDDGTKRGAEMALAVLLAKLVPGAESVLAGQLAGEMRTWRGAKVGTVGPSPALKAAVRALPRQSAAATAAAPR